jgi:membrane protein required for colicin V production
MFNWADWAIVAIFVISMGFSLMRGFMREVLSLVLWVLAGAIAILFAPKLMLLFANIIEHPLLQFAASFVILFIATLIIGGIILHLLGDAIKSSKLSMIDHGLGLVFGFFRGLIVVLVFLFIAQLICKTPPAWWTTSVLVPKIWFLMQFLQYALPSSVQQHIQIVK